MVSSSSKMKAALSPNRSLIAALPPLAPSKSPQQQQRWALLLYSVASRSLQATLTWNPSVAASSSSSSSSCQRLLFFNDDHVAGLFQYRHIVVWNIPRGIVSYTIDLCKGTKKAGGNDHEDDGNDEDSKMRLLDLVVAATKEEGTTSGFFFYALIQKESKLYVYEYDVETGRLQRKIKCGHAEDASHQTMSSTLSLAVVVTSSSSSSDGDGDDGAPLPQGRILLTTGKRQVKVMDLNTGKKLSKMKLAADTNGSMTVLVLSPVINGSAAGGGTSTVITAIPTASGVVIARLNLDNDKDNKTAELAQLTTLPIMLDDHGDQQGALQMWLKQSNTTTSTNKQQQQHDLMLLLNQSTVYEYPNIFHHNNTKTTATTSSSSLQPKCGLERDLSVKQEDQQHALLPMGGGGGGAASATLWHHVQAVLYRRGHGILVKPISLVVAAVAGASSEDGTATYRDKMTLSWKEDTTTTTTTTTAGDDTTKDEVDTEEAGSGKKRKQTQNVATTLGPGQAGHELVKVSDRPSKKQARQPDDDEKEDAVGASTSSSALTIAERLQQLAAMAEEEDDDEDDDAEDDMDDKETKLQQAQTKFVPKQATTQSLTNLLQQACASNDDGLLELALSVRDVRVIEQSMYELAQKQQQQDGATEGETPAIKWMDVVLTRLITRLANKPQRAEALSLWIQCWLQQYQQLDANSSTSAWQGVQGLLQPLRNLLQERVQTFSLWLQLEGRLSTMKS